MTPPALPKLPPRASGSFVASLADHVSVLDDGVADVARRVVSALQQGKISFQNFKCVSTVITAYSLHALLCLHFLQLMMFWADNFL